MSILFSCKIEVPYHGIKKNSKQIAFNRATGNRFIRSNDRAKFAEDWIIQKLRAERLKKRLETITTDINATFIFYFPSTVYYTKKNQKSKKIADLSNLYETVQDALQKANIIENDCQIESHDGSRRKPIDENKYYLEIILSA